MQRFRYEVVQTPGVRTEDKEETYTGTGFVVHPDGFLLTCAHVVDYGQAKSVTVTLDGKTYPASVLQCDNTHDLALIQIQEQQLPTLSLANSNAVRLGEEIRALGYPMPGVVGGDIKMTRGTIAGVPTLYARKYFQIDAPVNVGNSGGPIVNEQGKVVGIVNAKLTSPGVEGVGYAVPVNYARALLRNEFIELPPIAKSSAKLDGPMLAERVTPSVALLISITEEKPAPGTADQIAVADVVRTKGIELVDKTGKTRASLSLTAEGSPNLEFYDSAGKPQPVPEAFNYSIRVAK
jgi:V8-like Glu-specific endopeptidase